MKKEEQLLQRIKEIWEMNNHIKEYLINQADGEVRNDETRRILDALPYKQGHMVITIKELGTQYPQGIALKDLALNLGITEPSASVMVSTLVKKGLLKSRTSSEDRREIKIQLAEEIAHYFEEMDEAIYREISRLAVIYGPEFITEWEALLLKVKQGLRDG